MLLVNQLFLPNEIHFLLDPYCAYHMDYEDFVKSEMYSILTLHLTEKYKIHDVNTRKYSIELNWMEFEKR